MARTRRYRELSRLETFEDRFDYLQLGGEVGRSTFGFDRWVNQKFYTSREWRDLRREIIIRDGGCDLGMAGYELRTQLLIHHINPITMEDIVEGRDYILDPEYLITTSLNTHNAIHYGDRSLLPRPHVERQPGDTTLWTPRR